MRKKKSIRVPTTGTFDFETLITSKSGKYVDKTALLYELATPTADSQLFISRPRRFGKSLMLSTLKAMFEGRRDLFKGLAIDKLPWEGWKRPHPVYSFTMADAVGETYEEFKAQLSELVEGLYAQAGIPFPENGTVDGKFGAFIKAAAAKSPTKKIVVLIDEYDEPVAKFLDDLKTLGRVRSTLHDFYEKLKSNSPRIRFLMMTGVTKLTKLSVFSGLNHLTDISSFPQYATLLGYTPNELDGPLRENVEAFGAKNGMDFKEAKATILSWYDGYRFSPGAEARVCNPVSLGSAIKLGELKGYWEMTGRATLIINRIKKILGEYSPEFSKEDLLALWSFTGGVAKYVEMLIDGGAFTFDAMLDMIVREDSPFIDEGRSVLVDEFGRDYGTYFSILSAIATGRTTRNEISQAVGRDAGGYLSRLENDYAIISKALPLFAPLSAKSVRYRLTDCFLIFWFRFIFKYGFLLEIKGHDRVREIVRRDYAAFSGFALERYFREKFIESAEWTRIGSWWDGKGENEIDMIVENELNGNCAVCEIKRDRSRIDLGRLKEKYAAFTEATGRWKRANPQFLALGMEDM